MQMEQKPCVTDMNSQLQHKYYISFKAELHTNMTHTHRSLKSKHWRNIITFPCEVKVLNFECNVYFVRREPTIDVHIIHLCEYTAFAHTLWKSNEIIYERAELTSIQYVIWIRAEF